MKLTKAILFLFFAGIHGSSASTTPVKCSQIDYLFYNSDCCHASKDVPCMEQLAKVTYDATVQDIYSKIENVKTGGLAIASDRSLDVQDGATLIVHGSAEGQDANGKNQYGSLLVKQYAQLGFEAGAVLDLSKIALKAGVSTATRADIPYLKLSDVTGDVTFHGKVAADKGLSVDDQFTVADVTGDVLTKGSLQVFGKATSSALDVNGKLKVGSDGMIRSAGSVSVEDDLLVIDTSCANPPCVDYQFKVKQSTGEVEAKGSLAIRKELEVDGVSKLDGGINVANLFTVGLDGATTIDALVTMKKLVTMTGGGRLEGSWVVPTGSSVSVLGTLNIQEGNLKTQGTVSSTGITFQQLTAGADFNNQAVTNVKFTSGAITGVTIDSSAIGESTPSTVKATTLDASSTISGEGDLSVAGKAELNSVTIDGGVIGNVSSLTAASLVSSGDLTVQGDASVTGSLSAGNSTLGSSTIASMTVSGDSIMEGSVSMKKDVTFETKIIVNDQMQVGAGGASASLVEDGTSTGGCDTLLVFSGDAKTSSAALPIIETIIANGGACTASSSDTTFVAAKETQASCATPNAWVSYDETQKFAVNPSFGLYICDGLMDTFSGAYTVYKLEMTTSGAVDFAKDGTLKTSGKATLDSLEVVNAADVSDLTVSKSLVLDGNTSTTNGFILTSEGEASIKSVVVATTLEVSGETSLKGAQTSTALATFKAGLKTLGGSCNDASKTELQCAGDTCTVDGTADQTCVWTAKDGVKVEADGSVEANTLKIKDAPAAALSVEQSNHCSSASYTDETTCEGSGNTWSATKSVASISNDGVLQVQRIESATHIMPMYQQTATDGLFCADNEGVLLQAVGSCEASAAFREWSCNDSGNAVSFSDFRNNVHADDWMGSCSGTYTATYVAECSRYDNGLPSDTNNLKFCEKINTREQCLGTELILRGKNYVVSDVLESMSGVEAKIWTPTGEVKMHLCRNKIVVATS